MEKNQDLKKYTKNSLLASKKYLKHRDLLKVILDDKTKYTFDEVEEKLNNYLKGKVK